jgi:glucan phosphoethanolaminetransferase (alkaline phosphatase superfamily)
METKILFLILAILGLYVLFTPNGQTFLKRYIGVEVSKKWGKIMNNNIIYIVWFLIFVLALSFTSTTKSIYWFLVVVILSIIFYNSNKYKIKITTPEIMQ